GDVKPAPKNLSVKGKDCAVPEVFYVDPNSNAAVWVRENSADPRMPAIRDNIAKQPAGKWFGNWSGDIVTAVGNYVGAATAFNQTPILVAYNIPGRDCGQHSKGGANSVKKYEAWIGTFAATLGTRKAVLILEPDAIPHLNCLSSEAKVARLKMLRYAVSQFKQKAPNAFLYLDAGNSEWLSASVAADRLILSRS
ncbi:glycoside hydrolase family 6 protein, partial [Undibacterium sp.]|uniref:glycoside hydrolase family 6 protein n=1 Tax=Undibacterium sp. TaxID=1914977 RepID=UPI002C70E49E